MNPTHTAHFDPGVLPGHENGAHAAARQAAASNLLFVHIFPRAQDIQGYSVFRAKNTPGQVVPAQNNDLATIDS